MKNFHSGITSKAPLFHEGSFAIPPEFGFSQLTSAHQNVCVIGIIGQTDILHPGKGQVFQEVTECNAFVDTGSNMSETSSKARVEGFYDAAHATIFLHLKGLYDATYLQSLCDELSHNKLTLLEMRERYGNEEAHFLELMVFLFMISNVIVLNQIGHELNTEWIPILVAVNQLRRSIQAPCIELIRRLSVHNPSLVNQARVCSPRLVILLQPPNADNIDMNEYRLRELEAQLEDDFIDVVSLTELCITHVRREKALFELPEEPFVFIDLDTCTRLTSGRRNGESKKISNDSQRSPALHCIYQSDHPIWNRILDPRIRSFRNFLLPHLSHYIPLPLLNSWEPDQAAFTLTVKHWFKVCHRLFSILFAENSELRHILTEQHKKYDVMQQLSVNSGNRAFTAAHEAYKDRAPAGKYSANIHLKRYFEAQRILFASARGPMVYQEFLPRLWEACAEYWRCVRHVCASRSLMGHLCPLEVHLVGHELQQLHTALQWALPRLWRMALSEVEQRLRRRHAERKTSASPIEQNREVLRWLQSLRVCPHQLSTRDSLLPLADKEATKGVGNDVTDVSNVPVTSNLSENKGATEPRIFMHLSTCSCGWMQKERSDPFDWFEANYQFYAMLVLQCCSKFSSIPFHPTSFSFKPVTELSWYPKDDISVNNEERPGDSGSSSAAHIPRGGATGKQESGTMVIGGQPAKPTTLALPSEGNEQNTAHAFLAQEDPLQLAAAGAAAGDSGGLSFPTQDLMMPGTTIGVYTSSSESSQADWFSPPALPYGSEEEEEVKVSDDEEKESDKISLAKESLKDEKQDKNTKMDDDKNIETLTDTLGEMRTDDRSSVRRQFSNTEKVPEEEADDITSCNGFYGMLTTNTQTKYLPFLSSWCAVNIGPYHTYSHSKGVRQPGFIPGSNFLLPYNISFPQNDLSEFSRKPTSRKKPQQYGLVGEVLVKVFIGFEYECPQGHRFFLSGLNKRMTHMLTVAEVREALRDLFNEDICLYVPCYCTPTSSRTTSLEGSSSSSNIPIPSRVHMAQLMRLWVGLPNKDVCARVKLQVALPISSFSSRPTKSAEDLHRLPVETIDGGTSCLFTPSPGGGVDSSEEIVFQPTHPRRLNSGKEYHITLPPAALWLIRLPFIYETLSTDLHRMPTTIKDISRCRLLKNILEISVGSEFEQLIT